MSAGDVLRLDGVTRTFGSVTAVDDLSERFGRGEYFCILGPSGCGKTTLLRMIAGFERPDSGRIDLLGVDVSATPPERRDVNVVFQNYALFPHLSVRDNIAFGLRMKRLDRREVDDRVRGVIALAHLEAEATRLPRQLSGGQQQRVALARALVNRPAVLLLDEPLSALDQSLRQHMQAELRRIQRETRVTFIHITHDQAEALSLADRIAVMRHGRFEQVGPPRTIYRSPASAFVASFVGATNLLEGRVAGPGTVQLDAGPVLPVPALPAGAAAGTAVTLAVRPETLKPAGDDDTGEGAGRLAGRIEQIAFLGAAVEYRVRLDAGTALRVLVAGGGEAVAAEGSGMTLLFDPAEIVVLAGQADG
jgi:spermidine/putrescine ABC transporter ATP-binding subunit